MTKEEWLIALINGVKGKQGINGNNTYWYSEGTFYSSFNNSTTHNTVDVNYIMPDRNFIIIGE